MPTYKKRDDGRAIAVRAAVGHDDFGADRVILGRGADGAFGAVQTGFETGPHSVQHGLAVHTGNTRA